MDMQRIDKDKENGFKRYTHEFGLTEIERDRDE